MAADPRPTIDRAFSFADKVVNVLGELTGAPRARAEAQEQVREQVRETSSGSSTSAPALARFRVSEMTDASSGQTFWAVSDGTHRAECNSPEFAKRVFDALNGAPR